MFINLEKVNKHFILFCKEIYLNKERNRHIIIKLIKSIINVSKHPMSQYFCVFLYTSQKVET